MSFWDEPCKQPKPTLFNDVNKSKKQELRFAKKAGGQRVPASGALPGMPGDVKADGLKNFLIENKITKYSGIYIKPLWLKKIVAEAITQNRHPAVGITLSGQAPPVPKDWVMVPLELWLEVFEMGDYGTD